MLKSLFIFSRMWDIITNGIPLLQYYSEGAYHEDLI